MRNEASPDHYDNDDHDNDADNDHDALELDAGAPTWVVILRLGEHPVLVLRLTRSRLRRQRHLHRAEDVHRGRRLQQRHVRRPPD